MDDDEVEDDYEVDVLITLYYRCGCVGMRTLVHMCSSSFVCLCQLCVCERE